MLATTLGIEFDINRAHGMRESRYTRQAAIYSRPLISASQPRGIKMDYGLPYLLLQY